MKIRKLPVFGPKLGHFNGVFGKKVIPHEGEHEKIKLRVNLLLSLHIVLVRKFWFSKNLKIIKRPVFGPKLGHYYGVFGKKVIPHIRVLGQTNKNVISDFWFRKVHHTLFSNDHFDFSKIFKKIENPKRPCVRTHIGILLWGLLQKSHTSWRSARTDEQKYNLRFFILKSSSNTFFKW